MERITESVVPTADIVATTTMLDGFTLSQIDQLGGNTSHTGIQCHRYHTDPCGNTATSISDMSDMSAANRVSLLANSYDDLSPQKTKQLTMKINCLLKSIYISLSLIQLTHLTYASTSGVVINASDYAIEIIEIDGFHIFDDSRDEMLLGKIGANYQSAKIVNWKTGLKVSYPVKIKWKTAGNSQIHVSQFDKIYPVEKGVQSIDESGDLIILYKNKELSLLWYNSSNDASDDDIDSLYTQSKNPISTPPNKLSPRTLQTAIKDNDITKVKEFMEKGFGLEEHLPNQSTPLLTAVAVRNMEIALYLLELGANPNAKMKYYNGRNVLMLALASGNEELALKLIEKGADIKTLDEDGHNMLYFAAEGKLMKMFPLLLKGGLSLNTKREGGKNLMMFAAMSGNTPCVKALVAQGANVNEADDTGRTVLMYACLLGQKDTIKYLIKEGANLDAKDKHNVKAVYMLGNVIEMECRKELIPLVKEMLKLNNNEVDNKFFERIKFFERAKTLK